ncbi:hypothetical protein pipiens_013683 [Culex pipiens pipiens]|uniref:Uncharacterized protein n=1 Tax=Culex pipiens pipiens TaxID=38569 RepID=A0ABD1CYP4_CULPP
MPVCGAVLDAGELGKLLVVPHPQAMQLMTLNSLLMFDIVFIFFLFLVGVTCLVYYLPPPALGSFRKGTACSAAAASAAVGPTNYSCGTTTTCTGETVRFRRYSVGSLLTGAGSVVGVTGDGGDLLVTDCELEEILSLRGESPVLVAPPGFCACCAEQQQQQQLHLEQHLVENPLLLEAAPVPQPTAAIAGVDYVQIEIERTAVDPAPPCCYVRAKDADIKECHGPIHDV